MFTVNFREKIGRIKDFAVKLALDESGFADPFPAAVLTVIICAVLTVSFSVGS